MAGRPGAMGPPRRPDPNARRSSARIAALRANPNSQAAPTDNQSNPPDTDDLRPRSEVEPSDFEPESAVEQRVPTTSFSVATKRAIERDGTDCWHCNSSDALEHIHVLGRTRSTIMTRLQSLGRTNLEHLHQKENSMDPCNRCHAALDHHEDPGWVFIPTDLNFFIDFERTDYRRRVASFKKSSDGVCTQRIPPTPDQYVQACGGLYDMYMLRPFGSPQDAWQHPGRSAYQPNPKVWHGDPMLALFKAFHAVESNPHLLPEDSLMTLSRLYRANDEIPRLDGAIGDSSDDDDDSGDDNSDAGQDDADNPAVPPNSKRDNKGTSRGRGRGRGRGQANVLPSASGGARGKGRGYKTSAAPPAPERDTEDPSPPTGKIRGKGRGNGRGNGSASRAARNNCQEHKGLQDKDLEDKRWEGFKRRLEESQELVVSKRPKVEVSPFKWGPDQTSNAHVEDFKAHNAHMEACGYMMSWDKQEAESTEASKKVLQKGTKDEIKEELKDKIKVMGLLSPPATEDRILGGVGRGHRRLNVRLD